MDPPRFAKFDERSPTAKARKVAVLAGIARPEPGASMLYFGSRSNDFAAYFSKLGFGYSGTFAVDAVDTGQVGSGYQFTEIVGTKLPFPDERFDFIISNHVIKHFAGREQQAHLAELGRCLRDDGKLYIAVPNRWGLVDAHYRLPFLGWLPRRLAPGYLRLMRKADTYDWYPLSRREALRMLQQQDLQAEDVTLEAIRFSGESEKTGLLRLVSLLPAWFWRTLRPVVPTLFFVCTKRTGKKRAGRGGGI
jgi:SAM-dependent methyltransferase